MDDITCRVIDTEIWGYQIWGCPTTWDIGRNCAVVQM
jgi:hypothetical protein